MRVLAAIVLLVSSVPTLAQSPTLVRDLDTGPRSQPSSNPTRFMTWRDRVFFAAKTPGLGTELYVTQGTTLGTSLLQDINPGASSSHPGGFTEFAGAVYFAATTATHGRELWRTDGDSRHTKLVKDMVVGAGSASPNHMLVVGGTLYLLLGGPEEASVGHRFGFNARHRGAFSQLWKSDGTTTGTVLVKDLHSAGPRWARNRTPTRLWMAAVGNTLFFVGVDSRGTELWKSDGTAAGTVIVKDIAVGAASSDPHRLTVLGNKVFFTADDRVRGEELWSSDGTAVGTRLVKEIDPGPRGGLVTDLYVWRQRLYFSAGETSPRLRLWVSDGTRAGTVLFPSPITRPRNFIEFAGKLLFSVGNYNGPIMETDGTARGTRVLFHPIFLGSPLTLRIMGGNLYVILSGSSRPGLFRFVGSSKSVLRLRGSMYYSGAELAVTSKFLVFAADRGAGFEPWVSDGTEVGTHELSNLARTARGANRSAFARNSYGLRRLDPGDKVGFELRDGSRWESDGTATGTRPRVGPPPSSGPSTFFGGVSYHAQTTHGMAGNSGDRTERATARDC